MFTETEIEYPNAPVGMGILATSFMACPGNSSLFIHGCVFLSGEI
jgi:hypothetical protein